MRRTMNVLLALVLTLGGLTAVVAGEGHDHGKLAKESAITVSGEVLDMACYVAHGAQGADHAACAKRCAKDGQPIGLLAADGTVYLLYANHDDSSAFDKAKEFAGTKVKIGGKASTKAGITGIEVQSVESL